MGKTLIRFLKALNNVIIFLGLFILLAGCQHRKHPLDIKEFTKIYFDSLTHRFPNVKFSMADDSTILSTTTKNSIRISADNAYLSYQRSSKDFAEILTKYTSVYSETLKALNSKNEIDKSKILPVIKPKRYIADRMDDMKKMETDSSKKDKMVDSLVYEVYNDQLVILYVEDNENYMSYLWNVDLKRMHLSIDSIHHLALENLKKNLPDIKYTRGKGIIMPIAGASYDASLILRPNFFTKENFPVNGDIIIAIPSRDILLVTGSKEVEGIKKVKELSTKQYSTGDHIISDDLFKWNGNKFEKYDPSF